MAALSGRTLIGHDAKALAEWWLARGGTLPPGEDTAVVAYLLNPARTNYKLEEVCAELLGEGPGIAPPGTRAKWIWDLWAMAPRALAEVGLASLYEDVERPLIGVLAEMERHGIRIDQVRLGEFSRELEVHLERTTKEIFGLAGEEFNIGSLTSGNPFFVHELLASAQGERVPPTIADAVLARVRSLDPSTQDVLEQLALGHELPARIIEHRTLAKLKSTYADALPMLVNPTTGRLHTSFNQLVAATGRLSSSTPNLQNIPVRTELGRRIRAAFVPDPGWRFVAADYSQIELRILAHVSGEESLIEAFRRGEDIHARTASEVFGVALDAVTPEQRDIAKTSRRAQALTMGGEDRIGTRAREIVRRRRASERPDLGFARAAKIRLHDGHHQSEIQAVRQAVGDVDGCDLDAEVHRQVEIHRVVLENRHAVQRAVAPELRITPWKVDVLMSKRQIDVIHVHAAQRGEAKARSAYARQYSTSPQCLCPLGEDRSRRRGCGHRRAPLESECHAAAGRADRYVGDACSEGIGNERDQRCVLRVRRRYEMEAVGLQ